LSVYADTSFFVSIYIPDRHSSRTEQLLSGKPRVWLTSFHRAEWAHAIAQHLFRKELSPIEARRVKAEFERDRRSGLWLEVNLPDSAWEICADLANRHGSRLGCRTLDSLHVAAALELEAEVFWTFDERQARLAKMAGLLTS
jgi:predicted nucleic acid-binding protein